MPTWDPTEADVAPVRGRHRLAKQRTVSRGSTVLGVATVAAMGVGGVATAQGKNPVPISVPESIPSQVSVELPQTVSKAVTGAVSQDSAPASTVPDSVVSDTVLTTQVADPGEQLRARILAQAGQQQASAVDAEVATAEEAAAEAAAKAAAAQKVREVAAEKAAAKKAAEKAAAEKAERERLAREAAEAAARAAAQPDYVVPTTNYTISATFGQAGDRWSADHTGLDFAAPSGTAVRSVADGEITSAGWAGSYGYRIIVTHEDGTETWYCHLSSISQTSGSVGVGDTIGRVGATGNVTGPHLHFEVRIDGAAVDPAAWLNDKGVTI